MYSKNIISIVKNIKSCVRDDHEQCLDIILSLPQFSETTKETGFFVTRSGNVTHDHWWLSLSDGSIFDPFQDTFGDDGFGDIVFIRQDDPRQKHYFKYNEYGIPDEVLDFSERVQKELKDRRKAGLFHSLVKKEEEVLEDGGKSMGEPNRQSTDTMPDFITMAGKEIEPSEEIEPEWKEEEFEKDLSSYLEELGISEVDHPEYMPGEEQTRYDPAYDLGKYSERQPGYNTGHPKP
jgi:hypothetical protein